MRKLLTALSLVIVLILVGCTPTIIPDLKGSYQSEREGVGYVLVLTFQQDDSSFVEYIDNREVDRGTFEKAENNVYTIKSDKQNFDVSLNAENSFDIKISKLNNGKPIQMKNIDDTPIYFSTEFDDVDKYEALLD
jgi:hypothetical protein